MPGRVISFSAEELAHRAVAGERHPIARLISLVEDTRPAVAGLRDETVAALEQAASARGHHGCVIGVTGTPGSGKSSLLSRVATGMLNDDQNLTLAIVAVDPSSPISGGALLGDRTRMGAMSENYRMFFRSQASATALGGLAPSTFAVCHALSLVFDCVLVETVGIGQSEADIRQLADRVYLVIAPLGGDEIQYLKAGIIEIPDAFVINKWDEPTAKRTYHQLRGSLWLARPGETETIPLYRTSAKSGHGTDELARAFVSEVHTTIGTPIGTRAPHFFNMWVRDEWGRNGEHYLRAELGGARSYLDKSDGFAAAQLRFAEEFRLSMK